MTATSDYLNRPVRTEREAQLEAENARLRRAAAEVVRQGSAESIYIEALLRAIDGLTAALSTTASRGGDDGND